MLRKCNKIKYTIIGHGEFVMECAHTSSTNNVSYEYCNYVFLVSRYEHNFTIILYFNIKPIK